MLQDLVKTTVEYLDFIDRVRVYPHTTQSVVLSIVMGLGSGPIRATHGPYLSVAMQVIAFWGKVKGAR